MLSASRTFLRKTAALLLSASLPLAAAPAAAAARATLDGVEVGLDQVTLHMSQKVKYNTFFTNEPPRLIVELMDTEYMAAGRLQEGTGAVLKKVRSGQFQKEPKLISRIVLDLVKLVGYSAQWEDKKLVVSLQLPPPAPSEAAAAPAEAPAIPAAPAMPAVPEPSAPEPPAAAEPPQEAVKPAAEPQEGAQAELARMSKDEGAFSSEMSQMAKTGSVAGWEDGVASGSAPPKRAARAPASGYRSYGRRDIMSSLSTDLITLDFDGTDIRDILKLLAAKARVNIVYGADISGVVTLHLADVPFNEAFTTILQMQGLVANQAGENILRVMTPATLQKEQAVAVTQTRVIRLKYSKANEIRVALDTVRTAEGRQGKIATDDTTNSVIITDTPDAIASAERLLGKLDVRPQQVMIEAKLIEVKLSKDLHYGIQWDHLSVDAANVNGQPGLNLIGGTKAPAVDEMVRPFTSNTSLATGAGATGRGTGVFLPSSKVFGAFTFGRVTNNYFLSATLTAAATQGKLKVLSDPKIATLNGKKASINITTQIPYVTSTVSATGLATQNVSYVTTGIMLEVTPTVNADGRITLDINPTVSQPSSIAVAGGTGGAPQVDSRNAKTTVLVQDGETIVIGGLITDSISNTVAKVPLLGDIPFLGWLFKKKSTERSRVELLIFVTTRVLSA